MGFVISGTGFLEDVCARLKPDVFVVFTSSFRCYRFVLLLVRRIQLHWHGMAKSLVYTQVSV
jgi:hypothetical protein